MTEGGLNLLIVSDVHAFSGNHLDDAAPSYYSIWPQYAARSPFLSIPDRLREQGLSVDWVVCPGDLADRAEPASQAATWSALEKLRVDVGARLLVATVGNHDVDSRFTVDEVDTKGALQSLTPIFPGLKEQDCDFFWSRNFTTYEEEQVLLLVLNSSAFHGINSDAKDPNYREYEHGRVSDRTISAIVQRLAKGRHKLNILLTHHHFFKNDRINAKDYSAMINGTKLLDALTAATNSSWFVVHGHQHYPEITYARGDDLAPIVFSAGSFARKLNELGSESANQFYHIEFPLGRYEDLGLGGCGICRAWDWVPDEGWKPARGVARIASRVGFGCRNSPQRLARQIAGIVARSTGGVAKWAEVVAEMPELEFLLPPSLHRVVEALKGHSLTVYGNPFLEQCQICRE